MIRVTIDLPDDVLAIVTDEARLREQTVDWAVQLAILTFKQTKKTSLSPVQGLSNERLVELRIEADKAAAQWGTEGHKYDMVAIDPHTALSLVSEVQWSRARYERALEPFITLGKFLHSQTLNPDLPQSPILKFGDQVLYKDDFDRLSELISASPPLTPANIEHLEGEVVVGYRYRDNPDEPWSAEFWEYISPSKWADLRAKHRIFEPLFASQSPASGVREAERAMIHALAADIRDRESRHGASHHDAQRILELSRPSADEARIKSSHVEQG